MVVRNHACDCICAMSVRSAGIRRDQSTLHLLFYDSPSELVQTLACLAVLSRARQDSGCVVNHVISASNVIRMTSCHIIAIVCAVVRVVHHEVGAI